MEFVLLGRLPGLNLSFLVDDARFGVLFIYLINFYFSGHVAVLVDLIVLSEALFLC